MHACVLLALVQAFALRFMKSMQSDLQVVESSIGKANRISKVSCPRAWAVISHIASHVPYGM